MKKMVNYLSCIEGKGDLENTHRNTQNAALNFALFLNLFDITVLNIHITNPLCSFYGLTIWCEIY